MDDKQGGHVLMYIDQFTYHTNIFLLFPSFWNQLIVWEVYLCVKTTKVYGVIGTRLYIALDFWFYS